MLLKYLHTEIFHMQALESMSTLKFYHREWRKGLNQYQADSAIKFVENLENVKWWFKGQ